MAIPANGPISMNAMQIEAGGISGTQFSLYKNYDTRLLIKAGVGPSSPTSPGLSIKSGLPAYDPDAWGAGGGTSTGLYNSQGFASTRYYWTATYYGVLYAVHALTNDYFLGSGSTTERIGSGQISLSMWKGAAANTGDTWDLSVNAASGSADRRSAGNSETFLTVLETTGATNGSASYTGRIIYSPASSSLLSDGNNYYSDDLGDNWTKVTLPTITTGAAQHIGGTQSGSLASDNSGNVMMCSDSGYWWWSTNGGVSYSYGGRIDIDYARVSYANGYWFFHGYNYSAAAAVIYYKTNPSFTWSQCSISPTQNFAVDRITYGSDTNGGGVYLATGKPRGLNGSYSGYYLLGTAQTVPSNFQYYGSNLSTIYRDGVSLSQTGTWATTNKPQHVLWDSTITMPNSKTQGGFVMVGSNTLWVRYYHTSNFWDTKGYDLTTHGTDATDNFQPYGNRPDGTRTKPFREIQKDLNSGDYIITQRDGYYMQCKGGNDANGEPFIINRWNWTFCDAINQGGASFADFEDGVWSPTHDKLLFVASTTILMTPADPAIGADFNSPAGYGYSNRSKGFYTHSANPHYYEE